MALFAAFPTSVPMSELTKLNLGLYDEAQQPELSALPAEDSELEKGNVSTAPSPNTRPGWAVVELRGWALDEGSSIGSFSAAAGRDWICLEARTPARMSPAGFRLEEVISKRGTLPWKGRRKFSKRMLQRLASTIRNRDSSTNDGNRGCSIRVL